jgi:hypothetical protein
MSQWQLNTEEKIINFVSSKIPLLINSKIRNIKTLEERELSGNFSTIFGGGK